MLKNVSSGRSDSLLGRDRHGRPVDLVVGRTVRSHVYRLLGGSRHWRPRADEVLIVTMMVGITVTDPGMIDAVDRRTVWMACLDRGYGVTTEGGTEQDHHGDSGEERCCETVSASLASW